MMKRFQVFVRCRQLPSAHAEYTYSLDASAFHVAAAAGLKLFRREPHVKRRALHSIELHVTALGKAAMRHEMILPLGDRISGGAR